LRINRCLLLAALLALVHLARFDPTRQPIVTDVRYYVYFAEQTVHGAVPHRDYFDNKTQLAALAAAAFDAAGRALGMEPLLAMRAGYLALTGLAALLLFAIQLRLFDGSCVAGLLGAICYLGFSLLGFLPAIGPLPKLLMGIFASLAALLALRGAWLAAGVCATLAFLDWQVGALAGVAVLAAALLEREARASAVARTVAGGAGALAAFCAWLAWHGALEAAYRQVVLTSLARGSSALARTGLAERLAQIAESIRIACPGHEWLVVVGIAGMAVFPVLLWRHRRRPTLRLSVVIGLFNYGIVAFSLTDYQAYGDLFALLASLAFFAAVALGMVYASVEAAVARRSPAARRAVAVATVLVAAIALRVGRPRLDIVLPDRIAKGATTLEQQRSVARQIATATDGLRVLFVNCPEQLYLTGRTNVLPIAFWNRAAHHYFRSSPAEISRATLNRMIADARPDAVACPTAPVRVDLERSGEFERLELRAESGSYQVLLLRRAGAAKGRGDGR
jgi:hypothetical protein